MPSEMTPAEEKWIEEAVAHDMEILERHWAECRENEPDPDDELSRVEARCTKRLVRTEKRLLTWIVVFWLCTMGTVFVLTRN